MVPFSSMHTEISRAFVFEFNRCQCCSPLFLLFLNTRRAQQSAHSAKRCPSRAVWYLFEGFITLLETIVIFSSILAATYARYDHPFDYVHPPSPLSTKCQVVASNRAKITTNTIKCPKVSVIKVSRLWCAQHKILTPGLIVISILLTCITGADEVMCIHRSCTVHSNTVHKKPVKFRVFFTTVSLQYDDMKVFLVCHTDGYKYIGMFPCTQAKEVYRPKSSFCDRRVGSCEFEFVGCVRHPTKCGRMKKICVEETLKTQEGQPFHHNFQ